MNLGTAIILAFIILCVCAALFILLAIWLFRKGKKSEAAGNAYNIIALFIGGITFTILDIIIFVLPQPFSYKDCAFRDPKPLAYNDSLMWMMDRPDNYRAAETFGIYNLNRNTFTTIDTIQNEDHFFLNATSMAWNGKILAATWHGFHESYLVVSSGTSAVHKERLPSNFEISCNQKTGEFFLAGIFGPFSEDFLVRKYDRDFKQISSDTFHLDEDARRIHTDCNEFIFIGNECYVNAREQTFKLKFSGEICSFELFTANNDSLFLLEGSLQYPMPGNNHKIPFHSMITSRGIQPVAYPQCDNRYLFYDAKPYYYIAHDTISIRRLFDYRIGNDNQREEFQKEGLLTLKIHHPLKSQTAEYEISGGDSSHVSFHLYDGGRQYSYEMNLIRNNKLEIYAHGDMYAAFDLITEERLDDVSWKDRIKERFDNSSVDFFPWLFYPAVFVFPLVLLGILISFLRKRAGKSTFKMYPYSLIYFLFIGLPFLILLLWAMKGR